MSNFVYDKAREAFLSALIDMTTDTIKAVLVRTGSGHYVPDQAADQYLTAIASGDRLAISEALTSVTIAAGRVNADNLHFLTPTSNVNPAGALVLFKDTGTASTSRVIAHFDNYMGLPFAIDDSNITLYWPISTDKIFRI